MLFIFFLSIPVYICSLCDCDGSSVDGMVRLACMSVCVCWIVADKLATTAVVVISSQHMSLCANILIIFKLYLIYSGKLLMRAIKPKGTSYYLWDACPLFLSKDGVDWVGHERRSDFNYANKNEFGFGCFRAALTVHAVFSGSHSINEGMLPEFGADAVARNPICVPLCCRQSVVRPHANKYIQICSNSTLENKLTLIFIE